MPLYEYRCRECGKQFTFLAGVIAQNNEARCPNCQSQDLKKLISRVTSGRSDDARLDAMADRLDGADFDDPKALRRFACEMGKEMGAETGEDLSSEMEEMIESEANGGTESGGGDDGAIY